ncbi:glycosyl hydrolase family 65 protein, partial [Streptomyces bottropensis]|uniref:glycosyl hydrolase family 65 protein n=1 Tax=Streptomyces bottropensis TaxID=42235 RepID=UPI00381AD816
HGRQTTESHTRHPWVSQPYEWLAHPDQQGRDYLTESAMMDLADLEDNTRDGLHLASLAGTWTALVAGFGGMRQHGTTVSFAPRLPERLSGLAFHVGLLDTCLRVRIEPRHATYELLSGDTLTIRHHGEPVTLDGDKPRRMDIPAPKPSGPVPRQPPHRRPGRRRRRPD